MMIDIAERKYTEKCKTCGNEKESTFWDYCPFCGDSFPESCSNRRRRKINKMEVDTNGKI